MNLFARLGRLYFQKSSSHRLQIDALDGVRGLAIVWVIVGHLSGAGRDLIPFISLKGTGTYGVYLFFVLSSFLLSLPRWNEDRNRLLSARTWLDYFFRRLLRIYPLYFIVLVAWALATAHRADLRPFLPLDAKGVALHLLLLEGKKIFWAIPVEFKYYFALPLVVLILHLVARKRLWLCAGITAAAAFAAIRTFPYHDESIRLLPYLPIFLAGTLASLVHIKIADSPRLQKPPFPVLFEVMALAGFAAVILTIPEVFNLVTGANVDFHFFRPRVLFYGAAWSIFILGVLNGSGILRFILASRPARLIGIISFSLYLLHYPVLLAVHFLTRLHPTGQAVLVILLSFMVSLVTYLLIERPFMTMRLETGREKNAPRA